MPQQTALPPRQKKKNQPQKAGAALLQKLAARLPFSTPKGFARWFFQGINFWAVGAVALAALAGFGLVQWLQAPRARGLEQALAGGELTAGPAYTVVYGEDGVVITGLWDEKKGQTRPEPSVAAAVCGALSPDPVYGHSQHVYQVLSQEYFQGKPFAVTVIFRQKQAEAPFFSLTRGAADSSWPVPDCPDAAFVEEYQTAYDQYWTFGKGRTEELGPAQSHPLWDGGSDWNPPPAPSDPSQESSAPESAPGSSKPSGEPEFIEEEPPEVSAPQEVPSAPESSDSSLPDASSQPESQPREPQGFFEWFLQLVAPLRGFRWKQAPGS